MDTDSRTVRVLILIVQRSVLSGKQLMYAPWSLESRIHNKRCTSGSVRGYERPVVERPNGARSLLYSFTFKAPFVCSNFHTTFIETTSKSVLYARITA